MIDAGNFFELVALWRDRFETAESRLNQLDTQVGDGDHGTTMVRAFRAAEQAVSEAKGSLPGQFQDVANAIATHAGGAIGPLMASIFAEGALVFANANTVELDGYLEFLTRSSKAVGEIGDVEAGDKTMLDALMAAADFPEKEASLSLKEAVLQSARAAEQAAIGTSEMKARKGRARFTADRSKGHQDAGATSIAILLQTIYDFLEDARTQTRPQPVASQPFAPPPGKLVNSPSSLIQDDLLGIAAAYPGLVRLDKPDTLFRAVPKDQGKVALVIGHGGGHTPSMGGFVGPGLLDADVYGPLFTCASGVRINDAILQADLGAGVALLVSNHTGDVLNARLAVRLARSQGAVVESVLLGDDIATAPRDKLEERRGLGGLLFALKIGGAAAEAGYPLPEVTRLMQTTNERTATLAVALHPPRHPISGQPLFDLPDGEIEIGTGVHGEVGVYRGPHLPANEIIELLLDRLVPDLDAFDRDGMLLFVNGSGGTSQMELHTAYQHAFQVLTAQGIEVRAGIVGSFFTTLEMAGFSLSLCALNDELWQLWEKPASGAHFHWPYK